MRFVVMADANYADVAAMAMASIRHHHPHALIVQITDVDSPLIEGADEVWRCEPRYPEPWYMHDYIARLAEMDDTPTAVMGSDTLTRKPMDDVWEHEFDVALTWRPHQQEMPYNTGVVFCRTPAFYAGVLKRMDAPGAAKWMGDQAAIAREAQSGKWKVRELTCEEWNNSDINDRVIPDARMFHYKGNRKPYMARHFERGIWK